MRSKPKPGVVKLSDQARRAAANAARERGLACPTCGSPGLKADNGGQWVWGTPGKDLEIRMWCAEDPRHVNPARLVLSKEEARRGMNLRPRTD